MPRDSGRAERVSERVAPESMTAFHSDPHEHQVAAVLNHFAHGGPRETRHARASREHRATRCQQETPCRLRRIVWHRYWRAEVTTIGPDELMRRLDLRKRAGVEIVLQRDKLPKSVQHLVLDFDIEITVGSA